ncbi:MAG: DUF4399 domain-containing protein [Thermoanaerobaculia bacterium]|nr:DUF4399 domain-containing protein [Thermoanaerobaculia bacterium]
MRRDRHLYATLLTLLATLLLLAAACAPAGEETAEEPAAEAPAETAAASGGAPRVFLIQPAEGEEVTSPVHFEFGIENFVIEPREEGVINPGHGHHHIGINTHCLEPGIVIPDAEPWIHFGDGSNTIDVQLPPGTHHISLQVGDGEHRTLDEPGLCFMTDITVVE